MMDLYVLNSNYIPIAVIDAYKSLIWTKRYYSYGDFELYIPADKNLLEYLKPDYFLVRDDDESVMIIEKLQIETDAENGDFFIVSGRSLESIFTRRIISHQTILTDLEPVQAIKRLVDDNIINSSIPYRGIPGLVVDDTLILGTTLTKQITGDILLNAISAICIAYEIGMKTTFSDNAIILSFYRGNEVQVTFSPEYDNLINSKYEFDYTNYANFAFVAGEGEGENRRITAVSKLNPAASGLSRREIWIDARNVSSNNREITDSEYIKQLISVGIEKLTEHNVAQSFEAEIAPNMTYHYKIDYNLGDIITIDNEYGIIAKPRIIEIIESWDETGYTVIPTLEELEVS